MEKLPYQLTEEKKLLLQSVHSYQILRDCIQYCIENLEPTPEAVKSRKHLTGWHNRVKASIAAARKRVNEIDGYSQLRVF